MSHLRNAIILRTHFFSKSWNDILHKLKKDFNIIVIADTRKNNFQYKDFLQIEFNEANVSQLGLNPVIDMQWKCGDYALYLAYKAQAFTYAWLIETDVFLGFNDINDFFSLFEKDNSDLLCAYYQKAREDWFWFSYTKNHDVIYRGYLPICRVKGNIIDYLIEERIKENANTNDEAFIINTIKTTLNGSVKDFQEFAHTLYNNKTHSWRGVHYIKYLHFFFQNSRKIFHPVSESFMEYKDMFIKKKALHYFKEALKDKKYFD